MIGAVYGSAVPLEVPWGIVDTDDRMGHESFALSAFDRSLERGGQELWINHLRPALRGRFSRLAIDARQLKFRFELHDGPREWSVLQRVKVGDIRECSIGYKPEHERSRGISLLDGRKPAWFNTWVRAE